MGHVSLGSVIIKVTYISLLTIVMSIINVMTLTIIIFIFIFIIIVMIITVIVYDFNVKTID